jgi:hypothetical protein
VNHRFAFAMCLLCSTIIASAQNPGAVVPKPPSPLEQTIMERDQAVAEAFVKKDVEFFRRTLADDFIAVGTDGSTFGRADLLENMRETSIKEYRPYSVSVVPVNEGAAIVTYDCVVRMMVYDETSPRYQHISDLWVKQGDQWRLKFQQSTPTR